MVWNGFSSEENDQLAAKGFAERCGFRLSKRFPKN
jgi:hypothetical protein